MTASVGLRDPHQQSDLDDQVGKVVPAIVAVPLTVYDGTESDDSEPDDCQSVLDDQVHHVIAPVVVVPMAAPPQRPFALKAVAITTASWLPHRLGSHCILAPWRLLHLVPIR